METKSLRLIFIIVILLGISVVLFSDELPEVIQPVKVDKALKYVPGEVIIRFKTDVQMTDVNLLLSRIDSRIKYTAISGDFHIVSLSDNMTVEEALDYFSKQDGVDLVQPNYLRYIHFKPNDNLYKYQWHFQNIGMESAWEKSSSDPSVIVAVVDTGVAYEDYGIFRKAPDFAGTSFVPGYDFVDNDAHPNDEGGGGFGHGTFVTGVIAETTNNTIGAAGMAYSCSIMPVRVCNRNGLCPTAYVADGIRWAVDHGADVINISLGGSSGSNIEAEAVKYAYNNGVAVIASSGNDADDYDWDGDVSYPSRYTEVLSVGATRYDDTRSYYSNYGPGLDVVAPGGDMNVDQNNDTVPDGIVQTSFSSYEYDKIIYYAAQGTSFSAPHASALAAMLASKGLRGKPQVIYDVIKFSAKDLGTAGRDDTYGYGLIDPVHALLGLGLFE